MAPSSSNICNGKAYSTLPSQIHSPPHPLRCLQPMHLTGRPTTTIHTQFFGTITAHVPLTPSIYLYNIYTLSIKAILKPRQTTCFSTRKYLGTDYSMV